MLQRNSLAQTAKSEELPMVFYMFTDVKSQVTEMLFYGANAANVIGRAFNAADGNIAVLPGVVSRKKQVVHLHGAPLRDGSPRKTLINTFRASRLMRATARGFLARASPLIDMTTPTCTLRVGVFYRWSVL